MKTYQIIGLCLLVVVIGFLGITSTIIGIDNVMQDRVFDGFIIVWLGTFTLFELVRFVISYIRGKIK